MIQWKQRLYAFLLRRILGPFLDASATKQLHDSIDVSLQEGKFVLKDISLDATHLTELLADKVPGISVRTANIDRLEILLTLRENQDPSETTGSSNGTSISTQSSLAWRAMKLGTTTTKASIPAVSLIADITIDGISLELEPIERTKRKYAPRPQRPETPSTPEHIKDGEHRQEPSTKSVIGSYVDAALASLQLFVNLTNVHVKLCHFDRNESKDVWVAVHLSKFCYKSLDVTSAEGPPLSGYKMVVHKLLEFSEIKVVSGQALLSNDCTEPSPTASSTIALAEGNGQIFYRVIEYDHSRSITENSRTTTMDPTNDHKQLQQDIEIKLNQQFNLSVDGTSLSQVQHIVQSFGDVSEYNTKQLNSTTQSQYDELSSSPYAMDDEDIDRDDLKALTGIMRQYKEAYHSAERNELRGGILVPSNAYLDDERVQIEEDEEGMTFDVFFDANDQSFYHAASVMAKSFQYSSENSGANDDLNHVNTKLRCHLMSVCLKVAFRNPDFSSNSPEYLLATVEDLSVSMSSTHRASEFLLNISHFEVEDAQLRPSNQEVGALTMSEGALEIGKVVGFGTESSEPSDDAVELLLSKPPCITIDWMKTKTGDTVNIVLQPLQLYFRHRTLSNLSNLQAVLERSKPKNDVPEQSTDSELSRCQEGKRREIAVSFLCPSVTLFLPLLRRVATDALFKRSFEIVPDAGVTESSVCVLFENCSFEMTSNNASDLQPGQSRFAGDASFHYMMISVMAPHRDSAGFGVRMRRKDIVVMSGRTEVKPIIPISIGFAQVIPNGKDINPGRESFPIVPAISSFKARQEDDDDDENDENSQQDVDSVVTYTSEKSDPDLKNQLRAVDPQISMLSEAERSSFVVTLRIPDVAAGFTQSELRVILLVLDSIKPPMTDKNAHEAAPVHTARQEASASKVSSFTFLCDNVTLMIREDYPEQDTNDAFSFVFAADRIKVHQLLRGSSAQHSRILCLDPCIYSSSDPNETAPWQSKAKDVQGRAKFVKEHTRACVNKSTAPLLFRSQMFTPISNDTPSILLDIINGTSDPDAELSLKHRSLHLTLYHLTYRYEVDSRRISRLLSLTSSLSRKPGIRSNEVPSDHTDHMPNKGFSGIPLLTRLFVSCADISFDYTSPTYFKSVSRSIIRVGDLRLSSNMMNPAGPVQAYRLSIGDVNFHVSNARNSHANEDPYLCRSSWLMINESHQHRRRGSDVFGTMPEAILREMGFVNVVSLDMLDLVLSQRNSGKKEETKSTEPPLSIVLTVGNLSIQACKDSFNCFANSVSELQAKLTALTDEDISAIQKKCRSTCALEKSKATESHQRMTTEEVWNDEKYLIPEIEVAPRSSSTSNFFLLDGYDWTTIDHDPLKELEISSGEEQKAGWYDREPNSSGTIPVDIVHQHFPIQAVADPLSNGDLGVTRFAGKGAVVDLKSRLLLQKMNIRIRFFDGYDWPDDCTDHQREAAMRPAKMFVIEPVPSATLREKKKQLSRELERTEGKDLPKTAQLMGELLDLDEKGSSTFAQSPLPEDKAKLQDRAKHRQMNCRKSSVFFQVSLIGVTLRLDCFEESDTHSLQSIMELSIANFFVAETVSLAKPIKMFGEWTNDEEHPRDTRFGNLMLSMATWAPQCKVTEEKELESDECEVTVQLLPMRLLLDQRAIAFIKAFVNSETDDQSSTQQEAKWSDGLHLVPPPRFKAFKIKPWKVKVDYRPARMDVTALREGSIVELVNISPIHRMVITLSEVTVFASLGMGPVFAELVSSWVKEICATQLHKFLTNARPFEPFTDVGQGLTDLVILPYEAFQAGESVQRAMRKGVKSLADTIVFQTLTTTSGLTKYAANLMADILGGGRSSNDEANPLPSRPAAVPKGIGDVRRHACESLARGIQTANYKIVVVPYREFSRNGVTGAVTSVIKGIPVLLVAPLTGVTEAASYTLLGARNALRPDIRREEEASMSLH